MSESQLYDASFTVTTLDASKYDRVSRITGTSHDSTTVMTLDLNSDLYPVQIGEKLQLVLASTLSIDGSLNKDMAAGSAGGAGWRDVAGAGGKINGAGGAGAAEQGGNLGDMFDYVCRGKIYRFEQGGEENLKVYASFGGLLLYLEGPYKRLTALRMEYIYLLIKR